MVVSLSFAARGIEDTAIEDSTGKWEKTQKMTKNAYLNMPSKVNKSQDKAFIIVALSFAARGIEATAIEGKDVESAIKSNGKHQITVSFNRKKQSGVPKISQAVISGRLEVAHCLTV